MKICTITCHDVYNYGASLQAYALQTYLESLGHEVQIIDYKPKYQAAYNIWNVKRRGKLGVLSNYLLIVYLFLVLSKFFTLRKTKKRIKAFAEFKRTYLKCTERYDTYEALAGSPPVADVYIAGSDQIWRTNLMNGKDPAFYMQFGSCITKRISYAASFGTSQITDGLECFVRSMVSSLDAVSVREKSGIQVLSNLGVNSQLVCDPVFLMTADDWKQKLGIKKALYSEPYILVYDLFHNNKKMESFCVNYAKKNSLKIVAINDKQETPYAHININDGGPVEFVNLISNAQFVVADSFHATAFATIFHRPFRTFFKNLALARLQDFLSEIEMSKCLNPEESVSIVYDWNKIDLSLVRIISESKKFLQSQTSY